jgi:hypothetical protein
MDVKVTGCGDLYWVDLPYNKGNKELSGVVICGEFIDGLSNYRLGANWSWCTYKLLVWFEILRKAFEPCQFKQLSEPLTPDP